MSWHLPCAWLPLKISGTAAEWHTLEACWECWSGQPIKNALAALRTHAHRHEGDSVVRMKGRAGLAQRRQAQLGSDEFLSGAGWDKMRYAWGGKTSGLISRASLRRAQARRADDAARQATMADLGARLVSLRGALKGVLKDVVKSWPSWSASCVTPGACATPTS